MTENLTPSRMWRQMSPEQRLATIVDTYLSRTHRDDPGHGCVVPALAAEIARESPKTRKAFAVKLEQIYLERWQDVKELRGFTEPGRQILHTTFGSVLTHPEFGPQIKQILREHPQTYTQILDEHFTKHLEALKAGMK